MSQAADNPPHHRVLVTGVGGPSGRAAVRALRERGFGTVGTDMRTVAHEAERFYQVPAATAPDYLRRLDQILDEERVDFLFPTVSEELVIVAGHAVTLRGRGIAVCSAPPEAARVCNDKWLTCECLKAAGVAIPESALGQAGEAPVEALGFPRVSRPRVGRGGRDVVVHDGAGVSPAAEAPLWQRFCPGTEYDVLLVRHPRPPHKILSFTVFEKTVLREGRVGNAEELVAVDAPDVARLAVAAVAAVGLTGPADIDIRRDAAGTPRLLEINARIGAHSLKAPALFDALVALYEGGYFSE